MEFERPSAAQEKEIFELLLPYADNPLAFVQIAYPWGEAGTPLAEFTGPREWQREEFAVIGDAMRTCTFAKENGLSFSPFRAAYSSGRGPGKSAFLGMLAHWYLTTHLGANVIVAANTEKQLRDVVFTEIARWFTVSLNRHWFSIEGMAINPAPWLAQEIAEQLKIDPKFYGVKGRTWQEEAPSAFTGGRSAYGNMILFDEASGIPNAIWDITDGFFQQPSPPAHQLQIATSQMRRPSGRFYDLFFDPTFSTSWRTRTMDTRDPKYGIPREIVEKNIAEHGGDVESDYVRVEIRGLPPNQSERQLIPSDVVRGAQEREAMADRDAPLMMGVDPAPRGRTVIRFRQGNDARSIAPVVLEGMDNVRIAEICVDLINRHNPDAICIDAGNGTGVIDILKRRRVRILHEVWFGESAKDDGEWALRGAELWGKLRDWLPNGMIDKSATLFADLTKREWVWHGREGYLKALEQKVAMKARGVPSPDDGDALALTFAVEVPRRDRRAMARGGVVLADNDYGASLFKYD